MGGKGEENLRKGRSEDEEKHTSGIPHRLPRRPTDRIAHILPQIADGALDALADAGDGGIDALSRPGDRLARAAGEVLRGAFYIAATDGARGVLACFG